MLCSCSHPIFTNETTMPRLRCRGVLGVFPSSPSGSATQVMLATQFRATVGQKHPPCEGGQQQPWLSETRVQRVARHRSRKTVIFTAANRLIRARHADASVWPAPKTAALHPSSARGLSTCCASVSLDAGAVGRWGSVSPGSYTLCSSAWRPVPSTDTSSGPSVQPMWSFGGWKPKLTSCGAV